MVCQQTIENDHKSIAFEMHTLISSNYIVNLHDFYLLNLSKICLVALVGVVTL